MDEKKIQAILRGHIHNHILSPIVNPTNPYYPIEWNRYLPLLAYCSAWVPYHKTYTKLWAAKKYPNWYYRTTSDMCVMDITNGEIVYKTWEEAA